MLDAVVTYGGSTIGFAPLQPFGAYPWQVYVQPGNGHQLPTPGMPGVAAPSTVMSREEPPAIQLAIPQPFQLYGGAYSFAVFIPASSGKTNQPGHLLLRFALSLIPMLIIALFFYLKAYLRQTEPFRKKPDRLHVTFLFLGNNRQHKLVSAKTISSWLRKVLCVAKAHMSPDSLWGLQVLQS